MYYPCQCEPSTVGFFGTVGRNPLMSPGVATFDASLSKNIPIMEQTHFQFCAEVFNLFNHAHFSIPDTIPFDNQGFRAPRHLGLRRPPVLLGSFNLCLKFFF
jgi:hypothetical protein